MKYIVSYTAINYNTRGWVRNIVDIKASKYGWTCTPHPNYAINFHLKEARYLVHKIRYSNFINIKVDNV